MVSMHKNVFKKNGDHTIWSDSIVRQKGGLIIYQNTLNGNEISTFGNLIANPGGVVLLRENDEKNTFADDLTISKNPS